MRVSPTTIRRPHCSDRSVLSPRSQPASRFTGPDAHVYFVVIGVKRPDDTELTSQFELPCCVCADDLRRMAFRDVLRTVIGSMTIRMSPFVREAVWIVSASARPVGQRA